LLFNEKRVFAQANGHMTMPAEQEVDYSIFPELKCSETWLWWTSASLGRTSCTWPPDRASCL